MISIELLVALLRESVEGQIAYSNLASDLGASAPTVKSWMRLLEKPHLVFLLRPFSSKLAKSIRKEPKCYFLDCSAVENGAAARLENLVALALYKWCDFAKDTQGRNDRLSYYRDSNKREVDLSSLPYRRDSAKAGNATSSQLRAGAGLWGAENSSARAVA